MKKLDYSKVEKHIVSFLKEYAENAKMEGYVIGISGGVDSAVVSTLAAKTGLKLYTIQMPIRQKHEEINRATSHINWLMEKFPNVTTTTCDLTSTFDSFLSDVEIVEDSEKQHMAEANTRSRLRMVMLYYYASLKNCLVLGTGNKVEDFGVGFFTKGGDSQVDISPIGDLMKSEVRELGRFMEVLDEIVNAIPTDGLWDDSTKNDESQIGASYDELEWAMEFLRDNDERIVERIKPVPEKNLSERQLNVLNIYKTRHFANMHKMSMPPICSVEHLRKHVI